jgi:hypothetical protein
MSVRLVHNVCAARTGTDRPPPGNNFENFAHLLDKTVPQ